MAKAKGICKNIDADCSMAFNKTVQEVDKDDFVCAECGAPLKEVTAADLPAKKSNKTGLIGGIAAVVVAAGIVGGGFACGWWGGDDEAAEEGDGATTVEVVEPESVATPEEGSVDTATTVEVATPVETPTTGTNIPVPQHNLGYGTYVGVGYPNGVGAIKVTATKTFEMQSGTVTVEPGDEIVSAKITNGKLTQGELHRSDGTRVWIQVGAE